MLALAANTGGTSLAPAVPSKTHMGAERHGFRRTAASVVERRRAVPDGRTAERPHIKKSGSPHVRAHHSKTPCQASLTGRFHLRA